MKIGTENNEIAKVNFGNLNTHDMVIGAKNESSLNEGCENENNPFEGDLLLTLDERKRRLVEIENTAPYVVLEVVNKINLPLGAKITITPTGIANSMRNENDGIVYFGCFNNDINDKKVFLSLFYF